jgi:hypothetical protein
MSILDRSQLVLEEGYRSREAAASLAQLDELSGRMFADLESITPAELAWQPRPGTNTIGMLLAHIPIVEVEWSQIGLQARPESSDHQSILGIGRDDDGMPIREGAAAPAWLEGKDLASYRGLHDRGREYLRANAKQVADADLGVDIHRNLPNGKVRVYDRRWVLYHLVEHCAGHYGQILLLRHLYTARER